jgi:hypothetical protein
VQARRSRLPVAAMATAAALVAAVHAASGAAVSTAVVTARLEYRSGTATWNGAFAASTPGGRVVARGTVVDQRYTNGVLWRIRRTLTTRRGSLTVAVRGSRLGALEWTIASGTGAFAGRSGHGREVDRRGPVSLSIRMTGVPLP